MTRGVMVIPCWRGNLLQRFGDSIDALNHHSVDTDFANAKKKWNIIWFDQLNHQLVDWHGVILQSHCLFDSSCRGIEGRLVEIIVWTKLLVFSTFSRRCCVIVRQLTLQTWIYSMTRFDHFIDDFLQTSEWWDKKMLDPPSSSQDVVLETVTHLWKRSWLVKNMNQYFSV